MIRTLEEYQRTQDYLDKVQRMLLDLRATHTPRQYEQMSKAYLTELVKAQRDIALYLAVPASAQEDAA